MVKEDIEDVSCDEATATCGEDGMLDVNCEAG